MFPEWSSQERFSYWGSNQAGQESRECVVSKKRAVLGNCDMLRSESIDSVALDQAKNQRW
jgi:hypothetical protein